ncbi:MAG: TIGR00269 family protein [Aigarchaeota archaeon]|nr:TIGR00269 family protein [Aigarchaeota archaeon]MDW8092123.1 TIGR00269 family protein [Nitrososphaerota archaeon]
MKCKGDPSLLDSRDRTLCSRCEGEPPVTHRRYSGESLCRSCFVESFVKRVYKTIYRYKMFKEDDTIMVAVSGGKDSLSLLKVLSEVERRFDRVRLISVTIDEGIRGYRDESLEVAGNFSRSLGIEHHVLSLKELYGHSVDEVIDGGLHRTLNLKACSVCGVLRRQALDKAAKLLGATVIATAHTLDDIVQTYIMNLLRGDRPTTPLSERRGGEGVVPRVSPFKLTPQDEVVLYAYLNKIPFQEVPCPHSSSSQREPIKEFLSRFEATYPGTLYTALRTIEEMIAISGRENRDMRTCERCGHPTSRRLCRACEISCVLNESIDRTRLLTSE